MVQTELFKLKTGLLHYAHGQHDVKQIESILQIFISIRILPNSL